MVLRALKLKIVESPSSEVVRERKVNQSYSGLSAKLGSKMTEVVLPC